MGSASPAVDGMTAVPLDDVESQLGCPGAAPAQPPKFSFGGMMAQQDWGSILTTLLLSAGLFAAMVRPPPSLPPALPSAGLHAELCMPSAVDACRLSAGATACTAHQGGLLSSHLWMSPPTAPLAPLHPLPMQLCLGGPRQRPFLISDSTLAYPLLSDTFPIGLVLAVLVVALVGSVLAVELWVARATHADSTAAAAAALYFVLDGGMALLLCAVTTEVSKRVVGRLRPNFLAQCQPAGDGNTATVSWGDPASANPACTAPDSHSLTDAHYRWVRGCSVNRAVGSRERGIWGGINHSCPASRDACPTPTGQTLD